MFTGSTTRRLRAALLAAALAVGLAAPVLIAEAPAHAALAGGGAGWDDNGPGGSQGGAQPPTNGVGAQNFRCSGKYLVYIPTGQRAYEGPYPNCDPATSRLKWGRDGKIFLCPSGFQVFRFYGSYAKPAAAYTVSDLNLTDWCKNESVYSFWAANPSDATSKVPGSPWFSLLSKANPHGQEIGGNRFSQVGRTEFGKLSPGVRYSGSSSCTVAQTTPNPLAAYLKDPAVSATSKTNAKQLFWNSYISLSRNGAYPKTALATLGLKTISNKSGVVSLSFDTRNCASPMNYVSTADMTKLSSSAERAKFKVTGTCYIPVDRMAYELKASDGSTGLYYPTLAGPWHAGMRYSDFYKNSAYTKADPRGAQGSKPDRNEVATLNAWRAAMGKWFDSAPQYTGTGVTKDQYRPAAPYAKNSKGGPVGAETTEGWSTARSYLVNQSRCRFGSQIAFDSVVDGGKVSANTTLKMDNKQLFQSGGLNRVQEVSVSAGPLNCLASASACKDANPQLAELHYNVAIAGTGGYTECTGNVTTGCDYKVLSVTPRTTGKIQPTTVIQLAFFNPTMTAEKLKITVSGVTAKYQYQAKVGSINLNLEDPISGAPVNMGSKGGSQPFIEALPVTGVTGTPVAVTKSGTSYVYQAPVIGAVDRVLD